MRATICATPRKSAYMSIIKYGGFVNRFAGDGKNYLQARGVRRKNSVETVVPTGLFGAIGARRILAFRNADMLLGRNTRKRFENL